MRHRANAKASSPSRLRVVGYGRAQPHHPPTARPRSRVRAGLAHGCRVLECGWIEACTLHWCATVGKCGYLT